MVFAVSCVGVISNVLSKVEIVEDGDVRLKMWMEILKWSNWSVITDVFGQKIIGGIIE